MWMYIAAAIVLLLVAVIATLIIAIRHLRRIEATRAAQLTQLHTRLNDDHEVVRNSLNGHARVLGSIMFTLGMKESKDVAEVPQPRRSDLSLHKGGAAGLGLGAALLEFPRKHPATTTLGLVGVLLLTVLGLQPLVDDRPGDEPTLASPPPTSAPAPPSALPGQTSDASPTTPQQPVPPLNDTGEGAPMPPLDPAQPTTAAPEEEVPEPLDVEILAEPVDPQPPGTETAPSPQDQSADSGPEPPTNDSPPQPEAPPPSEPPTNPEPPVDPAPPGNPAPPDQVDPPDNPAPPDQRPPPIDTSECAVGLAVSLLVDAQVCV